MKETRPWGRITVAAVLLVAMAVGAFKLLVHHSLALTEKNSVVLADFANSTGDPVFDGTLRQGLAVELEQSPFLRITDDAQLQRDLRLMNVQPGTRITLSLIHI